MTVDYLDALMTLLTKSPQLPSGLKLQIKGLQSSMNAEKKDPETVSIPFKVRNLNELEIGEEE